MSDMGRVPPPGCGQEISVGDDTGSGADSGHSERQDGVDSGRGDSGARGKAFVFQRTPQGLKIPMAPCQHQPDA